MGEGFEINMFEDVTHFSQAHHNLSPHSAIGQSITRLNFKTFLILGSLNSKTKFLILGSFNSKTTFSILGGLNFEWRQ